MVLRAGWGVEVRRGTPTLWNDKLDDPSSVGDDVSMKNGRLDSATDFSVEKREEGSETTYLCGEGRGEGRIW